MPFILRGEKKTCFDRHTPDSFNNINAAAERGRSKLSDKLNWFQYAWNSL